MVPNVVQFINKVNDYRGYKNIHISYQNVIAVAVAIAGVVVVISQYFTVEAYPIITLQISLKSKIMTVEKYNLN